MPISLVDVAKYYAGAVHQTEALQRLQQDIANTNPALLADDSDFARLWRQQTSVESEFLITPTGIGPAQLGKTFGQIQQDLGSDYTYTEVSPFLVDLSAMAVLREGISGFFPGRAIAFYLAYPADTTLEPTTPINLMITANPKYNLSLGTGPGSLISEAVKDYGKVTLGFNTEGESREFARFERAPENITFRAEALTHAFAGDYSVPDAIRNGSFNETPAFFENASISQVWVQAART